MSAESTHKFSMYSHCFTLSLCTVPANCKLGVKSVVCDCLLCTLLYSVYFMLSMKHVGWERYNHFFLFSFSVSAFSALTLLFGWQEGHMACKNWGWVLAWLSVWSEVQTCMCPSWCHCHSLSLASLKSRLVLPSWYQLTRVVPDKGH